MAMAEPTLKDLLKAVTTLGAKIDNVRAELKADIAAVDAKVDAHRAETAKGFADLEHELSRHADPLHRDLEADIRVLHRALLRVPAARVPKELPSQVRAKAGAKPKAPAKAKRRAAK